LKEYYLYIHEDEGLLPLKKTFTMIYLFMVLKKDQKN